MDLLKRIWKEEEGQGLVEYGLILLLMVIIGVAIFTTFKPQIEQIFSNITGKIGEVSTGAD